MKSERNERNMLIKMLISFKHIGSSQTLSPCICTYNILNKCQARHLNNILTLIEKEHILEPMRSVWQGLKGSQSWNTS